MATNEVKIPIPARLYNASEGGHVAGADQIIDDETGLTLDKVTGGALEEKEYTSGSDNGMGRVVLRKNLVEGVNTLTQTMINKTNTIYVIQYDFTLGEDVTVPSNCILEFDGGSINANNHTISGQIHNTYVDVKWFGAKGDGITDDTNAIKFAVSMNVPVFFGLGKYKVTSSIQLNHDQEIYGVTPAYFTEMSRIDLSDCSGNAFLLGEGCSVHDLYFVTNKVSDHNTPGTSSTAIAISAVSNGYHSQIYNNRFYGVGKAIVINDSWCHSIRNNYIEHSTIGITLGAEANGIDCTWNSITYCGTSIQVGSARNIKIDTCVIETSNIGIYLPVGNVVTILNCYFENIYENCIKTQLGSIKHTITIEGCSFWVGASMPAIYRGPIIYVYLSQDSILSVSKCKFLKSENFTATDIKCFDTYSGNLAVPYIYENLLESGYIMGITNYHSYATLKELEDTIKNIGLTIPTWIGTDKDLNNAPLGIRLVDGATNRPDGTAVSGTVVTIPNPYGAKRQFYMPDNNQHIYNRFYNGSTWTPWAFMATYNSGDSNSRPSLPAGAVYFDTTLGKPIFAKTYNEWVDATGTTI